jgi:hypothetical protein
MLSVSWLTGTQPQRAASHGQFCRTLKTPTMLPRTGSSSPGVISSAYDPERPFAPWLMRIVLNAAADLRRKRRVRQTEMIPEASVSSERSPEEQTDWRLFGRELSEALGRLPERQRIAVTLFDVEGYSHGEIAGLLRIPEGDGAIRRISRAAHVTPGLERISRGARMSEKPVRKRTRPQTGRLAAPVPGTVRSSGVRAPGHGGLARDRQ